MNRPYPRVERERFHPQGKRELRLRCLVRGCSEPVRCKVVIEWSWFRGEDSPPRYICLLHGKKYRGAASIPNLSYVTDTQLVEAPDGR